MIRTWYLECTKGEAQVSGPQALTTEGVRWRGEGGWESGRRGEGGEGRGAERGRGGVLSQ
jgi:hypothetical protein